MLFYCNAHCNIIFKIHYSPHGTFRIPAKNVFSLEGFSPVQRIQVAHTVVPNNNTYSEWSGHLLHHQVRVEGIWNAFRRRLCQHQENPMKLLKVTF